MGVKQVAITLPNDVLDESTEYFGLHLSSPAGAGRFNSDLLYDNPWPLYCYIIDDPEDQSSILPPPPPPPHYEFSLVRAPIAMETDARAEIQVYRDIGGIGAVTLQWMVLTHGRSLQSGIDIHGDLSGLLAWADGETGTKTISISLLDDLAPDGEKYIEIALVPASGQPQGIESWGAIWIEDDDPKSGTQDQVYFEYGSMILFEGESGVLSIRRKGRNDGPITVQLSLEVGSAQLGEDCDLSSYTVTWGQGEFDDRTITAIAFEDSVRGEIWESVTLKLSIISGNASTPLPWELGYGDCDVTIRDTTQSSQDHVYVLGIRDEFKEGIDPAAEFSLARMYNTDESVTVSYTTRAPYPSVLHQAMPGSDFNDTVGSVSWAKGDDSIKTISIPLINDAVSEDWEYFYIELGITSGDATVGNITYLVIKDDDLTDPAGFRFVGSSADTSESRAHQLKIVRNKNVGTSTVALHVDGTATRNKDYLISTRSISFEENEYEHYVTIFPVDDGLGDPDETIVLTLVPQTAGWSVLSPYTYTVTLGEVADVVSPTVNLLSANGRQIIDTQVTLRSQVATIEIGTSDNRLVSEVTWKYGVRSGSARILVDGGRSRTWSIDRLPVGSGGDLMVTARDPQGNTTEAKLTIVYAPPKLFTMPGPLRDGDPADPGPQVDCTMTLLGLHPGDLLRYDRSTNQFIAVGSDEILMPGIGYLLDIDVDPPVFPPPGYHIMTVPTGRVSLANLGWNLVTISGGVQVVWDPSNVEAIINDHSMTLRDAIISGYLQAHCWAIDPLTGVMTLITQMPNAVPGSQNTIPAGAGIWIKKSDSVSVDLRFVPTTPAGRG